VDDWPPCFTNSWFPVDTCGLTLRTGSVAHLGHTAVWGWGCCLEGPLSSRRKYSGDSHRTTFVLVRTHLQEDCLAPPFLDLRGCSLCREDRHKHSSQTYCPWAEPIILEHCRDGNVWDVPGAKGISEPNPRPVSPDTSTLMLECSVRLSSCACTRVCGNTTFSFPLLLSLPQRVLRFLPVTMS
jgi:hypothetical protein